jgi:hypothetical protein
MADDLETMRQRLRDALFDVEDETWNAGEKDDLLKMAVRRLSRRLPRPNGPEDDSITLVSGTYYYDIPATLSSVNKVFYLNTNDDRVGYLLSGWEVQGDIEAGYGKLHVSPTTVEQGGTLTLHGYGRYTLNTRAEEEALDGDPSTNILSDHVPLVLAWAQEAAWRRLLSDRARFRQWQNANQVQNVSINELVQMIGDASRQADEEWTLLKRWQTPVIGRI